MTELPSLDPLGPGVAAIVDFDNTLTTADIGDAVADRFGGPRWREEDERFRRGELTLRELLIVMFGTMKTTKAELCAFAREVATLRRGAREFLAAAKQVGLPVVVASGGLDLYIRAILGDGERDVTMVCNRGHFEGDGTLTVSFPAWTTGCGRCGNCKRVVVEGLRARGAKVVAVVGDGSSDHCMARAADVVIARDSLLRWAREEPRIRNLVAPFDDFRDVVDALAPHVPGLASAFASRM